MSAIAVWNSGLVEGLEEALRDSEENFRLLCQAAFDGILVHEKGRIVAANERCAEMFGCESSAVIGRHVLDFTSPESHATVIERIREQKSEPFEAIGRRSTGERFPVEVCGISKKGTNLRITALRDLSVHKNNERELRAREERFRVLCQAAFDGIMVARRGAIVEVNHAFAEMFRYDAAILTGMPPAKVIWIESPGEEPHTFITTEAVGMRADGTAFPIEVCVASTDDGHHIYAVRDETERRSAESQLRESERRYRDLSESSHDLICDHDLDGNIVAVNPAAARALGIPREELCTMSIRDLLVPQVRPFFADYLAEIATNGIAEGLMVLRTRSGERRIWHYRNALRLTGLEKPVIKGLAHDVTEKEQALDRLQRSEAHFRSIIENATDVIAIIDDRGRITYHSPSTERLLGLSAEDLHNHRFSDFVHEDDFNRAEAFFRDQLESARPERAIDLRVHHRDGSWRWLSIVATKMPASNGRPSIITNGRDITDRRLLEAQLAQAHRLTSLGQLTATVAHEFNNVLMAMQPFADLMQRPGVSAEVVAKGARHIANSIVRGKRVALDMLRFARPAQPSMTTIDLREWWERLVPELQAPIENNVDFTWSFARSIHVRADGAQLTQVFANLMSNARDAMARGGTLRVEAARARNENWSFGSLPRASTFVHIVVKDSGTGMPEHVKQHAFDPLFTTKQSGGTGLGLAVAHQVVTGHGGFIFIETELGAGTAFHIFLPISPTAETTEPHTEVESAVRCRKVLIVEDEPSIAEGTAMMLRDRSMTVSCVERGADAEAAARELEPDVALIDIRLPDIDGLEVGRRLRALDRNLKIVFASGHGDASSVLEECAPATFLQKPFEIGAFLAAVAAMEEGGERP